MVSELLHLSELRLPYAENDLHDQLDRAIAARLPPSPEDTGGHAQPRIGTLANSQDRHGQKSILPKSPKTRLRQNTFSRWWS